MIWQKHFDKTKHKPRFGGLEILKYIGPGLLVTVGFIDPGNWASNIAAGSQFGYALLWIVTLSTVMLILLQHNVAHLGIATGLCLSEATSKYTPKWISRPVLSIAMLASAATSLAELLGAAIALKMLFGIPIPAGALLASVLVLILLFTNTYRRIERWIIGFVSIIGLSFIYELYLVDIDWPAAAVAWITPVIPDNSIIIIMSVLGAVVMPHNLFLHSEIIQSRQWNLKEENVIRRQLKFEFADTIVSMIIGWAINSAMILLAAATFFKSGILVNELHQAESILKPMLGNSSAVVFAVALLFSGIASSVTSGMAGGSIFSGIFQEPYDIKDNHSRLGVLISVMVALIIIFFISNPLMALIYSQMALSIVLPFIIFIQIYLTSSRKVMGEYANSVFMKILLLVIAAVVSGLNVYLLVDTLF
ncbi:MAG TPA: Nramp family divalent metal transporter [Bacteroidales bacterium]|nr:Nramp family divalent metal transporter [Bacteroidales bacterium]